MPTREYLVRIDDVELDEETTVYRISLDSAAEPCYAVNFWVIELSRWATGQPEVALEGYVKWDGCMNFTTTGSFHLCDPTDVTRIFAKLVQGVYAGAHSMFESVDYQLPTISGMREADDPV